MTSKKPAVLMMWTVYDHPTDYPTFYVARRFDIHAGTVTATDSVLFNTNIDNLRGDIVQRGFYHRLERNSGDDPKIMETWI